MTLEETSKHTSVWSWRLWWSRSTNIKEVWRSWSRKSNIELSRPSRCWSFSMNRCSSNTTKCSLGSFKMSCKRPTKSTPNCTWQSSAYLTASRQTTFWWVSSKRLKMRRRRFLSWTRKNSTLILSSNRFRSCKRETWTMLTRLSNKLFWIWLRTLWSVQTYKFKCLRLRGAVSCYWTKKYWIRSHSCRLFCSKQIKYRSLLIKWIRTKNESSKIFQFSSNCTRVWILKTASNSIWPP